MHLLGSCAYIPPLRHCTSVLECSKNEPEESLATKKWNARSRVRFPRGQFAFHVFNHAMLIIYNVPILCLLEFKKVRSRNYLRAMLTFLAGRALICCYQHVAVVVSVQGLAKLPHDDEVLASISTYSKLFQETPPF